MAWGRGYSCSSYCSYTGVVITKITPKSSLDIKKNGQDIVYMSASDREFGYELVLLFSPLSLCNETIMLAE